MSQPLSEIPDPGFSRHSRRRSQPSLVQEALQAAKGQAQRYCQNLQRYSQSLWRAGKRRPRTVALIGGAAGLTLVGAYSLSASGIGQSQCPAAEAATSKSKSSKTPQFLLLMDPLPHAAAGSQLEIRYDVCGLPSGTPYRGRVRLTQQRATNKKGSAKPKPLVVTFEDKVDGPASRRRQELELGSTRPGAYTLELSVLDKQGRERKKIQKLVVKTQ